MTSISSSILIVTFRYGIDEGRSTLSEIETSAARALAGTCRFQTRLLSCKRYQHRIEPSSCRFESQYQVHAKCCSNRPIHDPFFISPAISKSDIVLHATLKYPCWILCRFQSWFQSLKIGAKDWVCWFQFRKSTTSNNHYTLVTQYLSNWSIFKFIFWSTGDFTSQSLLGEKSLKSINRR